MLDDLDRTQAYIKKESVQDQQSTNDSAPESKFEQAQSSNAQSNTTPRSRQPSTSAQKSHFDMKTPKYNSQLPIENWISAMDIFMDCHNLSEKTIIHVSLAQLLTSKNDSSVVECFNPAELKNWEKFKSKLIEILGKDQDYFKHMYNTFQRENESQAMALVKIIAFFKKGYKKQNLDQSDQQIVCEKFISAQKPRLMELLTREKSKLNLTNIAKRATEIERSISASENTSTYDKDSKKYPEIAELCSYLKKVLDNMNLAE